MVKKILFILFAFSFCFGIAFSQKLEENGLTVKLDEYAYTEQNLPMFGKQKVILGKFSIKKKGHKLIRYDFVVPIMKGNISHIAVFDSEEDPILPRLYYIPEEKAYLYDENTESAGKEPAMKTGDQKEIILSGLLIWAKQANK